MQIEHQKVINKLNSLSSELNGLYHQAAKKLQISDSALMVIYTVYEKEEGCLLYELCAENCISKQTVNSTLRKLEKENILYLKQDKGKTKRIYLTEKGKAFAQETAFCLMQAENNAFKDWTEEEIMMHIKLMKKYNDAFKQEIEKIERKSLK